MPATHFARQFSDRQRAALVHAVLDSGRNLGGKRVAKLAAAGELPHPYDDLPPFIVSVRYVQELVSRERRRRLGQGTSTLGQQPPKDAARSVLAVAFDAIAEDLATVQSKKRGPERSTSLTPVLRATREALALEKAIAERETGGKRAEPTDKPKRQKQPATPADQLAARVRADTANGNRGTDSEGTSDKPSMGVGHGPSIGTTTHLLEAKRIEAAENAEP